MEERNFFEDDAQDMSFLDIESLVEDTQLTADAVCACNDPSGLCSCSSCLVEP
jgi:hypothetical protein